MQPKNKKAQMLGSAGVLFSVILGLLFATILFLGVLIPQTIDFVHNATNANGTLTGPLGQRSLDSGSVAVIQLLPMIEVFLLIGIYVGGGYVGYQSIRKK